ncbi:hypothetical protein [Candidatus Magnetomonas plexicatena]|uniref:hypothetical protein n=1 Tax=Candidatus Magnetomonas plexicatena TaxID=2552947 RepID=UPI0011056923|nr:hypothetical protein E2O03_013465 [Nitrospirales bacterium LBB_01]
MAGKLMYFLLAVAVMVIMPIYSNAQDNMTAPDNATVVDIPGFVTTKPEFTEGIFPCSTCHSSMTPNPQRRELAFHTEIQLKHAQKQRWCLDCHNSDNRDVLKLANGDHVTFENSYNLCGQCHGNILRDWKTGIHGKRTGYWNGDKTYYLCVNCHNPHSPRFKPLKPLPVPAKPQDVTKIQGSKSIVIDGKKLYIPEYKK